MNDKDNKKPAPTWTEQLNAGIDKLRNRVDFSTDFSFQEVLQTSWDSVKSIPPSLLDNYTERLADRSPVPADKLDEVSPCDFNQVLRYVGNQPLHLPFTHQPVNILTISSGGAKGAYGAGLLTGWAEKGDMPECDVITGVSTGAIIALFAFIGRLDELRSFYGDYSTDDLAEKKVFSGLMSGNSLYDNSQFVRLLQHYVDDVMIKQLADESKKGRVLLIGTTNLDRELPVTWDLTAIAATNSGLARQLVCDVMLASCAIPVVFPPVLFPVTDSEGNEYDELHVDGAAAFQMLIDFPVKNANIYALVNRSLTPNYKPAEAAIFDIGTKANSTMLTNAIVGDMYRLYVHAQRNNNTFQATWIPETFNHAPSELFDIEYMHQLFTLGHECALLGQVWHAQPPYFDD